MQFMDPLEQFDIILINYLSNCVWGITNISIMLFLNFLMVFLLAYLNFNIVYFSFLQEMVLSLLSFSITVFRDALFIKKYAFMPFFYFIFIFIFISNFIGMVPYSITVTSHLILTLYISLGFFLGTNIIGACFHKEKYFVLFLPEGVPVVMIPMLILIEYVSYFSRMLSLAMRLFANMMSGHILLKILIGFGWSMLSAISLLSTFSILPMAIVFVIIGLEFAISFLQAYVFLVLLSIYLNDVINTH